MFRLLKKYFWSIGIGIVLLLPVSASAISVSPLRQTISIDPGDEKIVSIAVTNDTNESIIVKGDVDSFIVDALNGFPIFDQSSIAEKWVTVEFPNQEIAPGQKKELPFIIDVPANAEPGSYYLSLFAETVPSEGQVAVGSRIGSLFYLDVAGLVSESLTKDYFSPVQQLYVAGPIKASLQLRNSGTYHVVPTGLLTVTNAFGDQIAKQEMNQNKRTVLADMKFLEEYEIADLSWKDIGPLTVRVKIHYGVTNQFLIDEFVVWYIPISIVAAVVGIFFFFLLSLILFARKKRRTR